MFSKQTITEIAAAARTRGLEPASLLAVAEVESAGTAFADIAGRREPPIRFEGHYFDARLQGEARERARAAGLSHPKAGRIGNPQTQAGRWRLLERAVAIDRDAAYESTSWGVGQVMGAHWRMLDFASVEEMVREARASASGQARLMAGYIVESGLDRALHMRDWRTFARGYNGPAFERNRYDVKLADAWQRYAKMLGGAEAPHMLRFGASGPDVEKLQKALIARGYDLIVDGLFGRMTRSAVKAYQKSQGQIADGIVWPATEKALSAEAQTPTASGHSIGLIEFLRRRLWSANS